MLELLKTKGSRKTENPLDVTIANQQERSERKSSETTCCAPEMGEDIVRSLAKAKANKNDGWVFFEAIGVAQLIGVGSSQATVTGNYFATYPTSPTPT
jgi:hypothetical protein